MPWTRDELFVFRSTKEELTCDVGGGDIKSMTHIDCMAILYSLYVDIKSETINQSVNGLIDQSTDQSINLFCGT